MKTTKETKRKKNSILVPYNFTDKAEIALGNAIHIARFLKAEIYLMTATPSADFFTELFRKDKEDRKMLRETKARLKEISSKISEKSGIKIHTIVEKGKWEEVALEIAVEINAQCIIIGKTQNESNKFFFFNNKDIPIIAKSTCPVIIAGTRPVAENGFKNIVLPLDLTKQTFEKVCMAITWAKYYKAQIHLVGVLSATISSKNSRLYEKMQRAQSIIEVEGIQCTNKIYEKSDKPVDAVILEHIEEVNGDLLMIMTHQEVGVLDTYIGEVAQSMIRNSEVPVVSYTSAAMVQQDHILSVVIPIHLITPKKPI